jgi:hypothetical protein
MKRRAVDWKEYPDQMHETSTTTGQSDDDRDIEESFDETYPEMSPKPFGSDGQL